MCVCVWGGGGGGGVGGGARGCAADIPVRLIFFQGCFFLLVFNELTAIFV